MFARIRQIAVLSAVVLLYAAAVRADPITVTSGATFLYWDGEFTTALLRGPGLSVTADGLGSSVGGVLNSGPQSLNGLFFFETNIIRTSSVTVNGNHYDAYLDGRMDMETVPLILPPPSGPGSVTFSTPFAMTGRLRGTSSPGGAGSVLFDVRLAGAGRASARASGRTDTLYATDGTRYEFEAPSPTPEPASLLLMGTGLVGIAARARRRAPSRP